MVPETCPEAIAKIHKKTWQACQASLRETLNYEVAHHHGDFLAHIVWRLGYEAGQVRRILSDNNISWGFYYDHEPNEPTNASIPDNFILLPPAANRRQLIAPVNFDKAYTRDSFLLGSLADSVEANRWPTETDKGEQDQETFTKWLNREKYSLEMCLGGDKGMANAAFPVDMEIDTHVSQLLLTALTDTCVLGFRSGFKLEEDQYPMDEEMEHHKYDVLQMALCLADMPSGL